MDSTIVDLFQLNDNPDMTVGPTENKSTYVSCIKIHGKPILPPFIDDAKRTELKKYKQKAIEIEIRLNREKKKAANQIQSECSSITTLPPSRQSTPARPATLNLNDKHPGKTYVLAKSKTDGSINKRSVNSQNSDQRVNPGQKCSRKLENAFRSTLEQRLALEENSTGFKGGRSGKCQQSPIVEEKWYDSEQDLSRWSPLKTEQLDSLRIEMPGSKDSQDETLEVSLDDSQHTPETVTQSPNLLRQNSYTLLTPSPALLSFLESQKVSEDDVRSRSQSGRKTWDLKRAKKKWDTNGQRSRGKTPLNGAGFSADDGDDDDDDDDDDDLGEEEEEEVRADDYHYRGAGDGDVDDLDVQSDSKKSSMDDLSGLDMNGPRPGGYNPYCRGNSGSGTSPESYGSKKGFPKIVKLKCKVKGRKVKLSKRVPSPKPNGDKVRFKPDRSAPDFVPSDLGKTDLTELSDLLLRMKVQHERQKKELEEKQQTEMKQLEIMFQRREAEIMGQVNLLPRKAKRSVYSQSSKGSIANEPDSRVMGDGNHTRGSIETGGDSVDDKLTPRYNLQCRRPHSAKDFHQQFYGHETDCNRRTRSMDFNQGTQDTDLDVSFQDDFVQSRDIALNNDYVTESDSISNFSSRSSTISSENRPDLIPIVTYRKFHDITSEEYAKYTQAATIITAAARGFLTRRLLRTAHVQGLIRTLKDAITCATQLHTASDIADSDIDLMRRLGRQIEAAWDAVYGVFFSTDTTARLQLIAADRDRLKAAIAKTPAKERKKRISSATRKSLDRKKGSTDIMSRSQTTNGSAGRVRLCSKMTSSYPGPYYPQKLK